MTYPLKQPKTKSRGTENLSARVYSEIKNLILSNEVMPGQKLRHQHLSERLGVSRTPVREALTRLVQEGHVSFLPNRGFTCKEIRMQEAEELYDLREAMEAFAVEKEEPTACTIRRGGLPPIKSTLSFLKRWSAGMWSPTVKPVAPSTTPVGRNPEREPPAKAGAGVEVSRRQCGSFARIFRK